MTVKPKVLVLDNFDSFTYNLVQLLAMAGAEVDVLRNNAPLAELIAVNPTHVVISPGPGRPPDDTGVTCEAILHFAGKIPVLGVCLGHQAIGHVYGGNIIRAPQVMHGKDSRIIPTGSGWVDGDGSIFANINWSNLRCGRYHSLIIDRDSLPDCLEITAETDDHLIMAVRHRQHRNVWGVQFHPESVLSGDGKTDLTQGRGFAILRNFLAL